MRIVTTFFEFAEEVRMVSSYYRLRDMGLTCSTSMNGIFILSETDDLINFCGHNPQFHIVSFCTNGFGWNRFHPEGYAFRLAEGNSDPNFLLDWRFESEQLWEEAFPLSEPEE